MFDNCKYVTDLLATHAIVQDLSCVVPANLHYKALFVMWRPGGAEHLNDVVLQVLNGDSDV